MKHQRKPKTLVFIVTSEMTAVTFLKGYLRSLALQGFDVTVVASSEGRLESLARDEGVRSASLAMHREPSPRADLASVRALTRLLRRIRPEIVVTATPKASLLGMLAAAATRVPIRVYQVWGLRVETEVGARKLLLGALERLTLRLATHIVANSHSLAEGVRSLAPGRRVDVIGEGSSHGVDLERFSRDAPMAELPAPVARALEPGRLIVGTVGRVHRDKGILTLLDAMQAVAAARPATLLVVGPGEDPETERRLEAVVPPLRVVRVGAVEDPRPYFLAMDVHVLPTLREGFPNVVLEAAALEVPTVTTDATGARDAVVDGVTGILVPPGESAPLARAIERLASDEALAQQFRSAGRRRVEEHFPNTLIWRLQAEYLELVRTAANRG